MRGSTLSQRSKRWLASLATVLLTIAGVFGFSTQEAKADGVYCGYWVLGLIEAKYLQKGGLGGPLGCPTTNELNNPGMTGKRSEFGPRGIIYWKTYASRAHPVWGVILISWGETGWESGIYRYPVGDEFLAENAPAGPVFQQNFECGYIRSFSTFASRFYTCH
ncbi:LGFP repeat-containing protein [Rhodococcus rhodochrous]|nr:hypothetical protein [Rhodococcus rhodochrous]